ncbi:molybdopterin-dependent oxidoreductase [Conexibacter sp. W3-3-2]|uniref:Sulfite oxidase-like oxidoreductase n=1 Tax=Paraconexibacter algicola TaxID=2133960 RepID=A0A2T4UJK5_9ACTN|nr:MULTISPECIES: sulfite oxidase-like oxidoreductase [Solirubrobacterales]MTD45729.1 molybdopterin-dependent oxidoreductase [Conexibacter sp. W3-3-2]PTL59395.1 sulfite oxidase-like oxidoreductase [Paraconexibacter algicola]
MGITSKMIGERGRRQAGKLGIDPARVPPGQYLTERFPVLTVGRNPTVDMTRWDLKIWGEVDEPYTLTWEELHALPQTTVTVDIHCVTRWSKLDTTWTGVRVSDLLDRAGVRATGTHVMAHCDGGYTTNVPLEALRAPDVLVAHSYEGAPLEPDHGGPLRLLVPSRYFWKSAKFLRQLEVMPEDRQGFWELNGYHNDADPFTEQRHWF